MPRAYESGPCLVEQHAHDPLDERERKMKQELMDAVANFRDTQVNAQASGSDTSRSEAEEAE